MNPAGIAAGLCYEEAGVRHVLCEGGGHARVGVIGLWTELWVRAL